MSESERYRRQDPERIAPRRDGAGWWLGVPPSRGSSSGDTAAGEGSWTKVVNEGVELGYRVVEEQIRQGQRMAEEMGRMSYGPSAMTSDFQEAAERMLRFYSDMGRLWLQLVTGFVGDGDRARSRFAAGRGDGRREAERGTATRAAPLEIQLLSSRPVRARLELRPGAESLNLATSDLTAPGRPPLTDVTFTTGREGGLTVFVRVPADQPTGTYHGAVIDRDTERTCGTLSVSVEAT